MPKTNPLLNVLRRVQNHTPQEFVAPLPQAQTITMSVMQDGVPHTWKIYMPDTPGWWVVEPGRGGWASPSRLAQPGEIIQYLNALPRFRVIVLFRAVGNTWVCAPAHLPDVAQRGWQVGEPRLLNIVRESVQPLDVVYARNMAGMLLYDEIDSRTDQDTHRFVRDMLAADPLDDENRRWAQNRGDASLTAAVQMLLSHYDEVRRAEMQARVLAEAAMEQKVAEEQAARRKLILAAQNRTAEERIQESLSFMGAQLVNWQATGKNFAVTWSLNGRQATTVVRPNMQVHSAGFCLNGTDDNHTLTSIIQVMEEARVIAHRTDSAMRTYGADKSASPLQMALGYEPDYGDNDDDD